MQVEDTSVMGTGESTELPGAPSANARRRIVVKSEEVGWSMRHWLRRQREGEEKQQSYHSSTSTKISSINHTN